MTTRTLKLAVLISGSGRTLQNFIDQIERRELAARIEVVVSSSPKAGGIARAQKQGIPLVVVNHSKFRTASEFSKIISAAILPREVDYVLLAGFIHLYLFPERLRGKVLNIHPALLPEFGGQGFYGHRVHEAVLKSGAKESGCTVHYADHEYDHGPTLLQRRVPVLPNDTPETLGERVFQAECTAYPEALRQLAQEL
jgi:formyltetrahydrofolate-dependent phosphoribosylglycinamide formyltransferase